MTPARRELPWAALAAFACLHALVSLALVRLGAFEPLRAAAVAVVATVLALLPAWRAAGRGSDGLGAPAGHAVALAAGLVALASSLLFPIHTIDAQRDEGHYVLQALRIAETGGLDLDDPQHARLAADLPGVVRPDYPGVYAVAASTADGAMELVPQFNHLTSAVRASGAEYAGLRGAVLASALFAFLAAAFLALLVHELLGAATAAFASLLLVTNAAFVWTSRSPLSEPFALFCIAAGGWLLLVALRRRSVVLGLMGAVAFGTAAFARPDGHLGGFLLLGFALGEEGDEPGGRRVLATALAAFLALAGLSLVDLALSSPPYFADLHEAADVHYLWISALAATTAGLGALAAPVRRLLAPWRRRLGGRAATWTLAAALVAVFVLTLLGAHRVIPRTGAVDAALGQLLFLTPPGLALFFAGVGLVGHRADAGRFRPFLLFTLVVFAVFLGFSHIRPVYPWASRRWVPYVLPLVLLLASLAWMALVRRWRGRGLRPVLAGVAAAALVGAYLFVQSRVTGPWLFRDQLEDWVPGYTRAARHLAIRGAEPYLTEDSHVAAVLTYGFGVETYLLAEGWRDHLPAHVLVEEVPGGDPRICGDHLAGFLLPAPAGSWLTGFSGVAELCIGGEIHALREMPAPGRQTLSFAAGAPGVGHLRGGWAEPEEWGTWSLGHESQLLLRVAPEGTGDLLLSMSLMPLVTAARPEQRVSLTLGGRLLERWVFTGTEPHPEVRHLRIPSRRVPANGVLHLAFRVDEPVSPAALGLSGDGRVLGIGLRSLVVAPETPTAPEPPTP